MLSGPMLDLLTDGVRVDDVNTLNSEVVKAVRTIMLSAHRTGMDWRYLRSLLTDTDKRRLARQIVAGFGGRQVSPAQRNAFLQKHWDSTAKVAASRPAWDRDYALAFVEFARETFGLDESKMHPKKRSVITVVMDLAVELGTTRPAVPSRTVADRTGLPLPTANEWLVKARNDGDWITLAKRGNARTGRATLYNVAPRLHESFIQTYGGAKAPMSACPPMSDPSMSVFQPDQEAPMDQTVSLTAASPAALAELLRRLYADDPATAEQVVSEAQAADRKLRVVGGAA